ncbi:hypothetical protein [Paenibacillus lacisoli]|nr:hypothetical protein [Paenibacillus sp. JX-17]
MIEHVFKPAYFVHPLEGNQYPNVGEIYERLQPTKKFSSRNELRIQKEKMIASAQQAFAVKGASQVTSIFDYCIYYVNK